MSQWSTDVLALVCITGGAVVGVGSLLVLSGEPEQASIACAPTAASARAVVVAVGGNESAIAVAPQLDMADAGECEAVVHVRELRFEHQAGMAQHSIQRALERAERAQARAAERATRVERERATRVERVRAEEVERRLIRAQEGLEALDVERVRLDELRAKLEALGIDPGDLTVAVSVPDQSFELHFDALGDLDLDLEGLEEMAIELEALEDLDLQLEGLDAEIAEKIQAELERALARLERTRGGSGR
jgi:hypothetical protein